TFQKLDRNIAKEVKRDLRVAAEPVRQQASSLARDRIPTVTTPWAQFRPGVTAHMVYVVPRKRSTKNPLRRRRNFSDLLWERAMHPAEVRNQEHVRESVEHTLDVLHAKADLT